MAKTLKIIFIAIVFLACGLWPAAYAGSLPSNYIRVAIMQNISSLNIKVHGACEVVDLSTKNSLYRGKNFKTTAASYQDGIAIGGIGPRSNKILIKIRSDDFIVLDGRKFRGNIQLIRQNDNSLLVINQIELEDYVRGILYHEVSHYWPIEVLKAQSIVCRSYALYQKEQMGSKDFDLTSDVYSQVYGGKTSERYRINTAVQATSGLILKYKGKILPAFFHAACAGHTEDAAVLWNVNIEPLKGVACNYCQESPHHNWHYVLALGDLKAKLEKNGHKVSDIKNIAVSERNVSGRAENIKISHANKDLKISTKDFRNIVGPNFIRSTNFNVALFADDIVFEGLGWGHGVGLCQWGAYFMAKQGFSYQDILKFYYPGSVISSLNN